jgi:hypothetical protein
MCEKEHSKVKDRSAAKKTRHSRRSRIGGAAAFAEALLLLPYFAQDKKPFKVMMAKAKVDSTECWAFRRNQFRYDQAYRDKCQ